MDTRQMSVSTLIRETGLTRDEVPLQFVGHNDDSGQKGVARAVISMRRMVHARKTAQAHSIAVSLKQNGVTPPCMHRIVQITFLSKGHQFTHRAKVESLIGIAKSLIIRSLDTSRAPPHTRDV